MRFLLTVILYLAVPLNAAAGVVVKNETIGFEIELPDGWVQLDGQTFYDNLGRMKFDDPEFQKLLAKNATLPAVIAAKHPEPHNDLNPSIKVNVRPYGKLPTRDPVQIINLLLAPLKKVFNRLEITSPPENVLIGGRPAAHVAITYVLISDAASFDAASELWIVPMEHFFMMIGIGFKQGAYDDRDAAETAATSMRFLATKADQEE